MQYQVILPLLALLLASLDESDAKFNRLLSSRTVAGARQLPEDVDSKLSVRGGLSSDTSSPSLVDMAIAGALATMVGDIAMHPVDCIKTLQQSNAGVGLSMLGASKSIFKTQGFGGFYAGLGTYVLSDGVAGSIKFATYETFKRLIKSTAPKDDPAKAESFERWGLFLAAGAAFIASSVVLVPGELVKQRLQMGQIESVGQGISKILREEGPLGFFSGYAGVCYRDVPYTMLELGLYDNFKTLYLNFKNRNAKNKDGRITQLDEIVCAAITGGITGYLTNPMDVVKTKLMTDTALYSGFGDAFRKQIAADGISSLFNGGAARVAWLMPFTAIYLPVYEILKRNFSANRREKNANSKSVRGGACRAERKGFASGGVCFV